MGGELVKTGAKLSYLMRRTRRIEMNQLGANLQ